MAGETHVAGMVLRPGDDQIEFTFSAPGFRASGERRYQYRLEGAGSFEWSALSTTRSVNFASLTPGLYRFFARAEGAAGVAAVEFRMLPPFWMRWWFRALLLLTAGVTALLFFRYRFRVALDRERLRTRIASDLHDDIGASLSRIAIWNEVTTRDVKHGTGTVSEPLKRIGDVSREAIDSMSDIVWAVNPKFDWVTDLATRMRRYVSDLSSGARIPISFVANGIDSGAAIGPEMRRDLFLVLKEALNKALRHSKCRHPCKSLSRENSTLPTRASEERAGTDGQNSSPLLRLSAVVPAFAEPDIHLLSRAPREPSQKIEFVFTASPETIRWEPPE